MKPGTVPTPNLARGSIPAPAAASAATSPNLSCATNALASLSARMYATSAAVRCQFTGTTYSPVWMAAKNSARASVLFGSIPATQSPGRRPEAPAGPGRSGRPARPAPRS